MSYWQHFLKAVTEPTFLFFCLFAAIVYGMIFRQQGWQGIAETISRDAVVTLVRFGPVCLLVIVIMAGIKHLDKANPGMAQAIIEGEHGEVTAAVTAAVMPGAAGGEPLRQVWDSGRNRSNVLFCLTAMMAMSMNAFMFRSAYLGWKLTVIYAAIGLMLLGQVYLASKLLKPWL